MPAVPWSSRALAVAALALLVACNDKALQVGGSADAGRHPGGSISPEQAAKVLAKIGDKTITLGEFVAALEHMDQFDRLRYQSPERRKELLRELVNLELLSDEAVAKGYDKEPQTQQEIRSILRSAMMEQAHANAPSANAIPDADVQAYYEAHRAAYREPERRRISVIVLPDDKAAAAVFDAARKATSAAQWGELVRAKSIDPSAKANVPLDLAGDYGMVAPLGESSPDSSRAPEEVRAAAFLIPKVGEVYEKAIKPAHEPHIYIVRLTQKTDAHERTLAESDRAIRVKLAQDRVRESEQDLLRRLREEYPVQIDDAVLATVKVDLAPKSHAGVPGLDGGLTMPPPSPAPPSAAPDAGSPH